MATTLTPTGLKTNDPGDNTWVDDQSDNMTLLNTTLLKPEGLADVDNTDFGANGQVIKRGPSTDHLIVAAPWSGDEITTTSTTTTSTTSTTTTV